MKKKIVFLSILIAVGYTVEAQTGKVGINTEDPKATLDINLNVANLATTTNEGILIPRLSKTRVAQITTPEESTLVYVNDLAYTGSDARVAGIIEKGFYYFNSSGIWAKVSSGVSAGTDKNIYDGDGILSGDRVVNMDNKNLTFESNDPNKNFTIKNNSYFPLVVNSTNTEGGGVMVHPNDFNKRAEFSVRADGNVRIWAGDNRLNINRTTGDIGIGTEDPHLRLHIAKDTDHLVRIQRAGSSDFTDLLRRVNGTFGITNYTGGNWSGIIAMTGAGNVGIGTESPNYRLEVHGHSHTPFVVNALDGAGGIALSPNNWGQRIEFIAQNNGFRL